MKATTYGKPFDIAVRLAFATVSGYFISTWLAILLAPALPGERHSQVLAAIEIVFLIYLVIFMWAFTRVPLKKLGIELFAALSIAGVAVWVTHGGVA
jgi:hypothetical protein